MNQSSDIELMLMSVSSSFTLTLRPVALNHDMSCSILHYVQPVHLRSVAQELILDDLHSSLQYLCGRYTHACKWVKDN